MAKNLDTETEYEYKEWLVQAIEAQTGDIADLYMMSIDGLEKLYKAFYPETEPYEHFNKNEMTMSRRV